MARVLIDEDRFFAWVAGDAKALAELDSSQRVPSLFTVKQFSQKHPAFPEGGLRHRIFHEETNGPKGLPGYRTERGCGMKRQPLVSYDRRTGEITEFASCIEAEQAGFNRRNIWRAAHGRCPSHKGRRWWYLKREAV